MFGSCRSRAPHRDGSCRDGGGESFRGTLTHSTWQISSWETAFLEDRAGACLLVLLLGSPGPLSPGPAFKPRPASVCFRWAC